METGKRASRVIIQVVPFRPKHAGHHTTSFLSFPTAHDGSVPDGFLMEATLISQ